MPWPQTHISKRGPWRLTYYHTIPGAYGFRNLIVINDMIGLGILFGFIYLTNEMFIIYPDNIKWKAKTIGKFFRMYKERIMINLTVGLSPYV